MAWALLYYFLGFSVTKRCFRGIVSLSVFESSHVKSKVVQFQLLYQEWDKKMLIRKIVVCSVALYCMLPSIAVGHDNFGELAEFQVNFSDCAETIGVGLVPTEIVRELIPENFVLVGTGQPVTPLVVRTAHCKIAINGQRPRTGTIVQIGAVIVPPDGTGDINNYTLFYYTDDIRLALRLILTGVHAQFVPTLQHRIGIDNSLFVRVPLPGNPRLTIRGSVTPSENPAGSFVANWWQATGHGPVKMTTTVPVISIGGAEHSLTTNANGALGQILGSDSLSFPLVQQFNTFDNATMDVQVIQP